MEDKRAPLIIKCSISAKSKLNTHLNATDDDWRRAGWPIRHIGFTSAALDSSETHEPLSCAGSWDLIPRMSCFAWNKRLAGDRQGRCNMAVGSSVCQTIPVHYMCCFVVRNQGLTIFFARFGAISHSQIMSDLLFFFISSNSNTVLVNKYFGDSTCILFLLQKHLTLSTVTLVWPAFSKHI